MTSSNTGPISVSNDEQLDFGFGITAEESRELDRIRYHFQPSPSAYFAFLTDCSRTFSRRPASREGPVNFDRPFELPDDEPLVSESNSSVGVPDSSRGEEPTA